MHRQPTKPQVITKKAGSNSMDRLAQVSMIVSFILIILGALGLIFFQAPLRESQDIREQASVESGQVEVTAFPASGEDLTASQEENVILSVNTNGVQTEGIQLVFNIVSTEIVNPPQVEVIDTTGLEASAQEIEQTADGYLVSITASPQIPGDGFSTDTDTPFLDISFTASAQTTVEFNFDVENSISYVLFSDPPEDELKTIPTLTYNVVEQVAQASPSPNASANPSPSPSASPNASPSPSASTSPSPSASPSPNSSPQASPTPTANTNVGGPSLAQCNDSCVYNKECASGLRCYSGACRLATNVSSPTCSNPPDQGISNECNEYCADNRECAAGLSCYFNRCRNPLNVESTACSAPSSQTISAITASCDESCDTHADCAANLLCYSKTGTCRLASNPSSLSCSPTTQKTVSPIYGTGGDKGGDITDTGSESGALDADDFDSEESGDAMAKDSEDQAMDKDEEAGDVAQTPLDIIRGYIESVMSQEGLSLPKILLGSGVGLLVLVIVALLVSRLMKMVGGPSSQTKQEMMSTPPPPRPGSQTGVQSEQTSSTEEQLQQKINQMKAEQQPTQSQPPTQPQAPAPAQPQPQPQQAQSKAPVFEGQKPTPSMAKTSSMADRLKAKGVQTPTSTPAGPPSEQPQNPPQNT